MRKLTIFLTALGVFSSNAFAATPKPEADPVAYMAAFNDTCRRGFPDLDLIANHITADGWVQSTIRRTDGTADIFSDYLPRAFHKGGMMLFLSATDSGQFSAVCQVTGSEYTSLTGADVAAVITSSLNAGQPTVSADTKGDTMIWNVAPGISVNGGVQGSGRKFRTITISVRKAR